MKITRVKYKSHPILGDLELDFTNINDGSIYQNIVIVGENGTGKTSILFTISDFLNEGSFAYFDYLEYEAVGKRYKAEQMSPISTIVGFHKRTCLESGKVENIERNRNNAPDIMKSDREDPRFYGCVFSKARADYKTDKINSVGTSIIDSGKHLTDDAERYTSLKQLLVDIKAQDEHDFAELCKPHAKKWADYEAQSRSYRFESAFNGFFDSLQFKGVETTDNEKKILFSKNGQNVEIDSLSTGEKQIVYRGAYLLRDNKNIYDGTVFIDEPELSMHPRWQKRILKYFTDLFTEGGVQKSQMFLASHSDFVVESALERAKDKHDTLVVILTEDGGRVKATSVDGAQFVLSTITAAEVNYKAFNIYSTDFHIALYAEIQFLSGKDTIKECDTFIASQPEYVADARYAKQTSFTHPRSGSVTSYSTLSTYVRNEIDHPSAGVHIDYEQELIPSTDLMISIIKRLKGL